MKKLAVLDKKEIIYFYKLIIIHNKIKILEKQGKYTKAFLTGAVPVVLGTAS